MKKLLVVVVALVALLVAAVLVGPSFVDWNSYKAEITSRVKQATGLDLYIDGDLKLALLPAPALVVNKVRLSNVKGAAAAEMVRLKSLQVRVALGPLLTGRVQVQTIRLVEPVIELERFADGRWNVQEAVRSGKDAVGRQTTSTAAAGGKKSADSGAGAGIGRALDVGLDNFVIENGTLIYRDDSAGTVEKIERINAKVAAASLSGPFDSSGSLQVRGFPVAYNVSLGNIIKGRTVPVSFSLELSPKKGRILATGVVTGLNDVPTFKGKIAGDGAKLSDLIHGLSRAGKLPGLLGQRFLVQADVVASSAGADLSNLKIDLGNAELTGTASAKVDKETNINIDLKTSSIDLDKWLAMPAVARPAPVSSVSRQKTGSSANSSVSLSIPAKPLAINKNSGNAGKFKLPDGLGGSLTFSAGSLTLRGGLVRQVRVNMELANGEVTISQLAAQLPGGANVAVFGFLSPAADKPKFDGQVEVAVSNLRGLMDWAGVTLPPVPSDRLRKMTLAGKVKATLGQIRATDIDLQFDSSRLTGAVTADLGKRPSLGVNLLLDRINLDAYLTPPGTASKSAKTASGAKATTTTNSSQTRSTPGRDASPITDALAGLKILNSFDANIKARVKTLVYGGALIKNIDFDGTLYNGSLDLRRFSIDKMAGSSVSLKGRFGNLSGVPSLRGVQFSGKITDLRRLMRLAGSKPPPRAANIGPILLKTRLDGSVLKPRVELDLKAAGGTMKAAGKLLLLPIIGGFDGKMDIRHKNLVGLLRTFGINYRSAGRLGGVNLVADVKANASGLTLSGLKGKAGPISLRGGLTLAINGPRPMITARLTTGKINVDSLLPVAGSASLSGGGGFIPAAFVVPAAPDAAFVVPGLRHRVALKPGKWPTKTIDLSAIKAFDADIKVKSKAIAYGKYRLENADMAITINKGLLSVNRLNGGLFGGVFDAKATVAATRPLLVKTAVSLKNINVAKALVAVTGEQAATGNAEMVMDLATSGDSVAALIAGLSGRGSIALQRLDVRAGGNGTAMSAALGLVAGLNNLGNSLLGGGKGAGAADITGSFTISGGVARSNDLKLVSGLGNGRAGGAVDLSRWLIDVSGQVDLSQNIVSLILNKGAQTSPAVPFSIRGRLDAPTIKLDTSKLLAGGLPIPGINRLLKKKGVGTLLRDILPGLGGAKSAPQAGSPPPPPPPPSAQPRRIKPRDLLKDLLKGLGN